MFNCIKSTVCSTIQWISKMMSEPDGTPSCGRTLTIIFGTFTIWLLYKMVTHMISLHDSVVLSIWVSNLPIILASLTAFILAPYTVNKGSGTFADIVQSIANAKMGVNKSVVEKVEGMMGKAHLGTPPTPPSDDQGKQ